MTAAEEVRRFADALVSDLPETSPDAEWWNQLTRDEREKWLFEHQIRRIDGNFDGKPAPQSGDHSF